MAALGKTSRKVVIALAIGGSAAAVLYLVYRRSRRNLEAKDKDASPKSAESGTSATPLTPVRSVPSDSSAKSAAKDTPVPVSPVTAKPGDSLTESTASLSSSFVKVDTPLSSSVIEGKLSPVATASPFGSQFAPEKTATKPAEDPKRFKSKEENDIVVIEEDKPGNKNATSPVSSIVSDPIAPPKQPTPVASKPPASVIPKPVSPASQPSPPASQPKASMSSPKPSTSPQIASTPFQTAPASQPAQPPSQEAPLVQTPAAGVGATQTQKSGGETAVSSVTLSISVPPASLASDKSEKEMSRSSPSQPVLASQAPSQVPSPKIEEKPETVSPLKPASMSEEAGKGNSKSEDSEETEEASAEEEESEDDSQDSQAELEEKVDE